MKKILFALIVIFILSCSIPDEFGIPSWNTKYKLKILNDTWEIDEIAEEDTSLIMMDNVLWFHETIEDSGNMDEIEINDPEPRSADISYGELDDRYTDLNGQVVPEIPAFDLIPNEKDFEPFEEFQLITFSSGLLHLVIKNETSIFLGNSPQNPLRAQIINYANDEILFDETYPDNISPGNTSTLIVNISNITVPNTLKVRIYGGSKGSDGEPVLIDLSEQMIITLNFSNIKASHVIARIPEQEIDDITGTETVSINYPEIFGTFELAGDSEMKITFNSPIPANSQMIMIARNDEIEQHLKLNNGEYPFVQITEGETIVEYLGSECNLNEFLSILPTSFDYILSPVIGDDSDIYYDIYSTDSLSVKVDFSAEINLNAECWIIPSSADKPKVEVVKTFDFDEDYYNAFISGSFHLEYLNNTGSETAFDILISETDFTTYEEVLNPDTTIVKMLHIPTLELTTDTHKELDIILKHKDLKPFLADSIYVVPRLFFRSDSTQTLSGEVSVKAEINLEIMISNDLIED